MKYIRYASPIHKQSMLSETTNIGELVLKNPKLEHFVSVYSYNEDQNTTFQKTKTAQGMTGMLSNQIIFDFDHKLDPNLALVDAVEMKSRLLSTGFKDKDIQVYTSGSKGFHLVINLLNGINKSKMLEIVNKLSPGLDTLDKAIYDEQRLFRYPLSINLKSNRYKIPLTNEEFKIDNLERINKLATTPNFDERISIMENYNWGVDPLPEIQSYIQELTSINEQEAHPVEITDDRPDFTQKTKELTEAKYALQMGFFEDGERNQAFEILAATYKYLGYPKEFAHRMLKATDELYVARMDKKGIKKELKPKKAIWNENINHVYGPLYRGGTFSEKDNPLLQKTIQRYNIKKQEDDNSIIDMSSLSDVFKKFATEIDKNTIKLGFDEIDRDIQITTSMLVYLLAAPSAGKSSITFSILNHASKHNLNTMFFSLDMGAPLVYQRLLQKQTGMSSKTIFNLYKNNDTSKINEFNKQIETNYKNVKFCFRSGLTIDDIEKMIQEEKKQTGEYPKLIAVDYLECLTGPFADQTANSGYIANRLKDVANKYSCTVLLLVQPQKSAGDPSAELNSMRCVKGSSVLEQAASIILTLSRPGFDPKNPANDKYATITVVKNRMGQLKSWDFSWNGLTGQIGTLFDEDRKELEELRSRKAVEKQEANKW
jgi:hypothetical protein